MNARSLITALTLSCLALPAQAATTPDHLLEDSQLQLASGAPVRVQRNVSWSTPFVAAQSWTRFVEAHGTAWKAYWDADTSVPGRIFGVGIPMPGTIDSDFAAERAARDLLEAHIDLLAPGADLSNFVLVSNELHNGVRTVGFFQHHRGLRVVGGQVSFRFKADRMVAVGSEALPHVNIEPNSARIGDKAARDKAASWIANDFGSKTSIRSIDGVVILPLVRDTGATYREAVRVVVDGQQPVGRWNVYLDATTGEPIAREQLLKFQQATRTGTIRYNSPERHPGASRVDWPARTASLIVDGAAAETNNSGEVSWTGSSTVTIRSSVIGPRVRVVNDAGNEAIAQFDLANGATHIWDARDDELVDAQLNTFIASHVVLDRAKVIAPTMRYLNEQLRATVNLDNGSCNAFSDGTTINFYQSSRMCENTGRIADVVYHEFGHGFHAHAVIRGVGEFESALSEGGSDYMAATVTNDPGMGRGFFRNDQPLRHIDQPNGEARWPEDVGESHTTGIIFAGALWDLRKSLIGALGEEAGIRHTDALFYAAMQRSSDIPSSFVEVLIADDDDGNLSNGTPHQCQINDAFARHGLADSSAAGPGVQIPELSGMTLSLPVMTGVECPGTGIQEANLEWRLRRDPNVMGNVPMTTVTQGYEGLLPAQLPGEVVQYRVTVRLMNGDELTFPENEADPFYETFIGEVTPLYCTDFEIDPEIDGWNHSLDRGEAREGADDWQWGVPQGATGSGDPSRAFSGNRVIGNDLGADRWNGTYQPNKTNSMRGPVVQTDGHDNVRVQFRRWLNVENAFFDKASILANNSIVWSNLDSGERSSVHHTDKEWRFQDVDVSSAITNGQVEIGFQIESDGGLELGGWTIDDFCVVAFGNNPGPQCGDGKVDPGEACDDGNLVAGDGCEADCSLPTAGAACGNGVLDAGEACDPGIDATTCSAQCTLLTAMNPDLTAAGGDGLAEADKKGCGCETTGPTSGSSWILGLLMIGALFALGRRTPVSVRR